MAGFCFDHIPQAKFPLTAKSHPANVTSEKQSPIASIPTQSAAMFISSDSVGVSTTNVAADAMPDMAKVKIFLESKIVRQRLSDFGLTSMDCFNQQI